MGVMAVDGTLLVGVPIGLDAFVECYVLEVVRERWVERLCPNASKHSCSTGSDGAFD